MPVRTVELPKRGFRQGVIVRANDSESEETPQAVELAFSSEEPVERWFGFEVLGHKPGEYDASFLESGRAPLLVDHKANLENQIGTVERVSFDGGKGRAVVRFGQGERAREIAKRVADGEIANVSVGYAIRDVIAVENPDSDFPTYRLRWAPLEISFVPIPADFSAGVGRARPDGVETLKIELKPKVRAMPDENQNAAQDADTQDAVNKATEAARQQETTRIREIEALGSQGNCRDLASEAIKAGQSVEEFRGVVLMRMLEKGNQNPSSPGDVGLSQKEARQYSLTRALHALANPNNRAAQEAAGFEIDCSNAAIKKRGRSSDGIVVPPEVLRDRSPVNGRALNTGTIAQGGALVQTDLLATSFIDLLRARAVVTSMGARMLNNLEGNIAIPRLASGATAYWVGEGADVTKSQAGFDQVLLSPKTVGAFTDYSKQLLAQSSLDVEMLVRDDLAKVLGLEVSRVALYGSGTSNQPQGVSSMTGINTVTLASANPTYAEVVQMETEVATDDADVGALGYVISPAMRGGFKTTEKASGTARFVWEDGGTVNGYNTGVSTQVAANNAFFGNWEDLLIAMWSGLDLTVDPYSQATNGTIRVIALQMMDIAGRHPQSFCRGATA